MEALTISAANLDAIERNLGTVANELSGVINNVVEVNDQVNKVEEKVASLNDEIKGLVKEIRETTIVTNARQSIMFNNENYDKKFGYYDVVRRKTESLLEAVKHSNVRMSTLVHLKDELLLNNPNYWLSNALAALISWIVDDKDGSDTELNNALKKNKNKTSIFFALVNLELGRKRTALNWLDKYLSDQNPTRIDADFVTVLDLVANGEFGREAREKVLLKMDEWFRRLNSNKELQDKQVEMFSEYISSWEEKEIVMPRLETKTPDIAILKNNLTITSSFRHVLNNLKEITYRERTNKSIMDVLHDLIYDYEENERSINRDNLKNSLIIECNGDREKALRLFEEQEMVYDDATDLVSMLSNIVIHKDNYNVSNETQMIALSLVSKYIIEAYEIRNSKVNLDEFTIHILGFSTKTTDGTNMDAIKEELKNYLHSTYDKEDKDLIIPLLIINMLGIVGIFITLNSKVLSTILILLLVVANVVLFYNLNKRKKTRDNLMLATKNLIMNELEKLLAETLDYRKMIKDDMDKYDELMLFLKTLKVEDYIKRPNERTLKIGE